MKKQILVSVIAAALFSVVFAAYPCGMMNRQSGTKSKMSMDDMMKQCREHCDTMSSSMETMLDNMRQARASNDPVKMQSALADAEKQLGDRQQHMSMCPMMMDMQGDMGGMHGSKSTKERAAGRMMVGMHGDMGGMPGSKSTKEHAAGRSSAVLPRAAATSLNESLDAYEAIRAKLAADSTSGISEQARRLATAARSAANDVPQALRGHVEALARSAGKLQSTSSLDAARRSFDELSEHAIVVVQAAPELAEGRHLFTCPMRKASWIQTQTATSNPYMGQVMASCGSQEQWQRK